ELVEVTSGNTGVALAAIGQALGNRVRIYMPNWMSQERLQLIRGLGATIVSVSREQGGFLGSIRMANSYALEKADAVRLDQFSDVAGIRAHREGTGAELVQQLRDAGLRPTAFVAGVGTGGTVMGVGAALREGFGDVDVHPLEPANSPTLRTGSKVGEHRIQGISDEFVPELLELDSLDRIVDVDDGDAIRMAQRLSAELGMGLGISSGANLLGALRVGVEAGPGSVVATVFADCSKKYLSTALAGVEPVLATHLTDRVSFREVRVLPRVGRSTNNA
ncbi:MAG: cysteine synthase A, partial [Planctomycetota bacterium]